MSADNPGVSSLQSSDPLLLIYTPPFGRPVDTQKFSCNVAGRWTSDRSRLSEAAGVIFHIPDFRLFRDARKYPGQSWVAWSMESDHNYPMMADPRFMRHFDITMTYRSDADVWNAYLPGPAWWQEVRSRPIAAKTAPAPVVLFQSSNFNLSGREQFSAELARLIEIDSYGRFLKNRSIEGPDLGRRTKISIIGKYRFCLALENSICVDYVTEKLFDPLQAGTVPIYLGAPNVREFAPPGSFINAAEFGSASELAAYLRHLVETPDEYAAYFDWRSKPFPPAFEERLRQLDTHAFCRLLALVRQRRLEKGAVAAGKTTLPFGRLAFLETRVRRLRKSWRSGRDAKG